MLSPMSVDVPSAMRIGFTSSSLAGWSRVVSVATAPVLSAASDPRQAIEYSVALKLFIIGSRFKNRIDQQAHLLGRFDPPASSQILTELSVLA